MTSIDFYTTPANRRACPALCVAGVLILMLTSSVEATPIVYDFTAVVTSVSGAPLVSNGSSFSGRLIYESTTPDFYPSDPDLGWYVHPQPLGTSGISVQFPGAFSYTLDQDALFLFSTQRISNPVDDLISIQYTDSTASMPAFPTVTLVQGDFDLRSPNGLLANDAMVTNLHLADFSISHRFSISGLKPATLGGFSSVFSVQGNLTSLMLVPEPASVTLALGALFCLLAVAPKRAFR